MADLVGLEPNLRESMISTCEVVCVLRFLPKPKNQGDRVHEFSGVARFTRLQLFAGFSAEKSGISGRI